MNLINYEPSFHFKNRYKYRCKNIKWESIKMYSKNLCNRNDYGIYLFNHNNIHYIIHTNNQKQILLTIYHINYQNGFRDFIKFYITKPRVLKHDMKYNSFERVFKRILSKYNNKLKKTCKSLFDQSNDHDKEICRRIFCQTVFDYREFYFKYLNEPLTFEKFMAYCKSNNIIVDQSKKHSINTMFYLIKKLNKEQIMNFIKRKED